MTTAEPPYPLVTPVTKATMAGKPAYTVLNTVLLPSGCCAPFEPPPAAPLPGQRTDEGRRPPNPRTGARMAELRTSVVAARLTRAERADRPAKAEAGR